MNTLCEIKESEVSSTGGEIRPEKRRRRCGNREFSPMKGNNDGGEAPKLTGKSESKEQKKPPFRPAIDDTKPFLKDPILRSDPIETEEAVLRLPPFPFNKTAA